MPEAAPLRELAENYGLDLEQPRVKLRGPPPTAVAERPQRNTPFFGREAEMRALDDLLRDPTVRLVTLFGMGGVGKTRLAARLAERLVAREPARFRDGVAVVPLESDPRREAVVPAIAARLALPAAAGATTAALADALAGWHALLVLDNFEHVRGGRRRRGRPPAVVSGAAPSWSRAGRGWGWPPNARSSCAASRREGNWHDPSDAARLFLERAERVGFPPEAAARDLDVIEQLCADLEGYPLGIELAASMTRALGVREIRAALAGRARRPRRTGPSTHRNATRRSGRRSSRRGRFSTSASARCCCA